MDKKKKSRKKKIIIAIVIIGLIGGGGIGISSFIADSLPDLTAPLMSDDEIMEISKRDLVNNISVSGTVQSGSLVKVTSTITAKIKSLNVSVGDYVKEGDVLCIFDSSDIQKEYDNLKENIDKANQMNSNTHEINQRNLNDAVSDRATALEQAQRNIDKAQKACDDAYEKYNNLVDKHNTYYTKKEELYNSLNRAKDEEEYQNIYQQYQEYEQLLSQAKEQLEILGEQLSSYDDAVQSAYDAYNSTQRSADSSVQNMKDIINSEKFNKDNSSEVQLEKLEEQLSQCTVTASKSGIITSLNVAEGSIPSSEALMTIEDDKSLKISVQIKEADILNVKEGLKAIIKTDATGSAEINGTVSKVVNILSGADATTQQTGGYTAEISVDDTDSRLLIGMNAKVRIILEEKKNVLSVPYDAVCNKDGKDIVYIAREQDDGSYIAESVEVEKGMEGDYYTEIISGNIKENEFVVSNPELAYDGKVLVLTDNKVDSDIYDGVN